MKTYSRVRLYQATRRHVPQIFVTFVVALDSQISQGWKKNEIFLRNSHTFPSECCITLREKGIIFNLRDRRNQLDLAAVREQQWVCVGLQEKFRAL